MLSQMLHPALEIHTEDEDQLYQSLFKKIKSQASDLTKTHTTIDRYISELIHLVEKRYTHFESISSIYNELTLNCKYKTKEKDDLQDIITTHQNELRKLGLLNHDREVVSALTIL
jgi:hypothetical protein